MLLAYVPHNLQNAPFHQDTNDHPSCDSPDTQSPHLFMCMPARTVAAVGVQLACGGWCPTPEPPPAYAARPTTKHQTQARNAQSGVEWPNGCSIDPMQGGTGKQEVERPSKRPTKPNTGSIEPTRPQRQCRRLNYRRTRSRGFGRESLPWNAKA